MSRRKFLVADLLCGAGGSSTGCARALRTLGLEMELVCVNHWGVAIETHSKNHPEARHFCQDIATVRPHIIVPEGYLDLLMASPTCTHHSVARGGKPTSDQQRSDPWHIVTWLTELRVKRIIIENVWEFIGWGPVDARTGKPVKSKKGEYFHAWIETIRRLGFDPEWRKLNAANYGDATTRQRFILKARNDRRIVAWAPLTHQKRSDDLLLFPTVKPWKPARDIIDWQIKGRSIYDRKKPLAAKTLARIHAGLVKFGWPEAFIVTLRNHMSAQGIDIPLPTIAARGTHVALAQPFIVKQNFRRDVQGVDEPAPTVTTVSRIGVAEPFIIANRTNNAPKDAGEPVPCLTTAHGGGVAIAEPIILNRASEGYGESRAHSVDDPAPIVTTAGGGYLLEPFVISPRHGRDGAGPRPRAAAEPLPTVTAGGSQMAIVEPIVVNLKGQSTASETGEPLPTQTAHAGHLYVAEPFVMSRHGEGAPRSTDDPTPTQVAKHSHCLISAYYGSGSGEVLQSAEEPLPTVTVKNRFGMVVPVTHTKGGNAARDLADPLPTLTTAKGGELAMVMPVTHADRSDRARDIVDPLPTVTGAHRGEQALVEGIEADGLVYDILFRMLEPHELAAAMGFTGEDQTYEFAGTKTEKIKQIGNAVSVAMMEAEVGAIMADAVKPAKAAEAKPRRRARA